MKSKLTKKYYVPGLISALIIPLFFWFYGTRELQRPIPNIMDLGLPAKYNPNIPLNEQFSVETFKNWNYKKIKVASKAKENSKFYVSEIKNLQKRNEKNTGIEFILDDENSYNDFVSILNDLSIAKHQIYGLDLDKTGHVFALVDYQDSRAKKEEIECLLCNDAIVNYVDNRSVVERVFLSNIVEKYRALSETLTKESLYLLFGFLILLTVSILNIKKFI
ncbi:MULTISPECIES: hypothetical protein [unclassified Kaistella]|uniref:hypothetical protein n=1 Tax=unclassified Kaistella TaxID=2762626 RepID=UPI002735194C|nr:MULTISPECIES: hypothetical protein [unclassified Kaistella]MDP2453405.1 hypothetical protein [Kaistella sp. SH11-4b]MDP2456462.1 hypothetical protein [Kaistella sp. SH40-3]MDP2459218.1 hypothetical protein [Kaistella sp. SH19-2b]